MHTMLLENNMQKMLDIV